MKSWMVRCSNTCLKCNERMEVITSAMARQEGVTEALKAVDQTEWVCRKNSIHNRAEEIVLHELVCAM